MSSKIKPTDQCALAEAAERAAQAELHRIGIAREQRKDAFDDSQDYRNGYIQFSTEIVEPTVDALTGTMRRMSRLYPKQPVVLEFNTPGGSIIDGFRLMDEVERFKRDGTPVTIRVRGQACSMGTVILQSATTREIGPNSLLMLHRASFAAKGTTAEVEDAVEEGKMLESQIYKVLSRRTGKSESWWKKKLGARKDVWWTAEEALRDGLVDAIV